MFENKARFAIVAKDRLNGSCLLLRGYINLKSPCVSPHLKGMLGKYSTCRPSYFGDMVNLCRLLHIDKGLTTIGRLKREQLVDADPAQIVKILVESIERKDGAPPSVRRTEVGDSRMSFTLQDVCDKPSLKVSHRK